MSASPVIDVHAHLAPLPSGEPDADKGPAALHRPDQLLTWMDAGDVDRAWVSAPPPYYRQGLGGDTAAWVRRINDGLASILAPHDRLEQLAYLPLDDPAVAVAEAGRLLAAGTEGGPIGWTAAAGGRSVALDSPELVELWAGLAESGRPLLLHPGASPDARLSRHYLGNLLGNPSETGVAVAELVLGGVLRAHPGLRIVLVHGGGIVPAVVGRWQRGVDTERPGVDATLDPRREVRRLWTDCLTHSAELLELSLATFGEDKVVLGSDWPFAMGLDSPADAVASLPAGYQDAVLAGNVRVLLQPAGALT